jgi:hypothetical protein
MSKNDAIRHSAMTLAGAAAPLRDFLEARSASLDLIVNSLDAFAFRHLLRLAGGPWRVVDRTLDATGGAFALLAGFEESACAIDAHSQGSLSAAVAKAVVRHGWQARFEPISPCSEADVLAVITAHTPDQWQKAVDQTKTNWPQATLLLYPLGKTGACPAIQELLRRAEAAAGWNAYLVREAQPLLGESRLGILTPRPDLGQALVYLGQLFEGNFQFADLIKRFLESAQEIDRLERQLTERTAIDQSRTYRAVKSLQRIRHFVAPPGSLVARAARFAVSKLRRAS